MAIGTTIVLDYELIETGTRSRTSLSNDRVAVLADNGVDKKSTVLASGNMLTFTNIVNMFFLRCNSPLQIKINRGNYFTITSLFVATAGITEISIFNNNSTDVNCLILNT